VAESEVMRLMQEIELRCQAACLTLHGYAKVAKHEVIASRFDAIGRCQDELGKLIGTEEANKAVALTYIRVMDREVADISKGCTQKTKLCDIESMNKHLIQHEKGC
jgi:hypothetical protein